MKKTQRERILDLLKENDKVNSYDLTYKHSIKQAPTRIYELRQQGYTIVSSAPLKDGSIDYYMVVDRGTVDILESQDVERPFKWTFDNEHNIARKVYQ